MKKVTIITLGDNYNNNIISDFENWKKYFFEIIFTYFEE